MDLHEYRLTEGQRTLKRAGITHFFQEKMPVSNTGKHPNTRLGHGPDSGPQDWTPRPTLQALFHGKQCPALTLWTYTGLGLDLDSPTRPERLSVFYKIQESVCTHLGWQASRIASWPLDEDEQTTRYGLSYFNPSFILAFAQSEEIATGRWTQVCQNLPGLTIISLPDINPMVSGDRETKNRAWKILTDLSTQYQF